MIRSLCIVSRDYLPDASHNDFAYVAHTLASACAAQGIAVHVITQSNTDPNSLAIESDVVVHRILCPGTPAEGCPDVEQSLWAAYASSAFRDLDAMVGFDVVFGPDRFGETARIEPGVGTLLAVQLHNAIAINDGELPDGRHLPADRAAAQFELLGMQRADVVIAPNAEVADTIKNFIDREIVVLPPPCLKSPNGASQNPDAVSLLPAPAPWVTGYLEIFSKANPHARIPPAVRRPTQVRPKLGIIMLAHNRLSNTMRAVGSILGHTDVPFELIVVDNASTDETAAWCHSVTDPRLRLITCTQNHGVPGGRNIGLDALGGDEDFIVFLDNDIEVLSHWWEPYVNVLKEHPEVGIVGHEGYWIRWSPENFQLSSADSREARRCDSVAGHCMVIRARTLDLVGRFDERLGLFWHDSHDYAMRANRIGEAVFATHDGRVLHFGHRSPTSVDGIWNNENASAASEQHNARYLAHKHDRQQPHAGTPFLILADLDEVFDHPELLRCYATAFTNDDEAGLLLYGPGTDPTEFQDRFAKLAASIGIDIEQGPKIIAMLPATADELHEITLCDEVYGMLSMHRPAGRFQQLAWLRANDADTLRSLAARAWRARPLAMTDQTAAVPEAPQSDIDRGGAGERDLVKLNLGAGELRVPGFLSVDLREDIADVVADVTDLPYADESVEEILAFDLLEHFPADRTQRILAEWKRVLITGGYLTLKVPNLQALGQMIHDDGEFTTTFIENVYGGHRYGPDGAWDTHHNGWTPRLLRDELALAGFHLIANDLEPNMTAKARKLPGWKLPG